jgi:hypothetical protein
VCVYICLNTHLSVYLCVCVCVDGCIYMCVYDTEKQTCMFFLTLHNTVDIESVITAKSEPVNKQSRTLKSNHGKETGLGK